MQSIFFSIGSWCEIKLQDYHLHFSQVILRCSDVKFCQFWIFKFCFIGVSHLWKTFQLKRPFFVPQKSSLFKGVMNMAVKICRVDASKIFKVIHVIPNCLVQVYSEFYFDCFHMLIIVWGKDLAVSGIRFLAPLEMLQREVSLLVGLLVCDFYHFRLLLCVSACAPNGMPVLLCGLSQIRSLDAYCICS